MDVSVCNHEKESNAQNHDFSDLSSLIRFLQICFAYCVKKAMRLGWVMRPPGVKVCSSCFCNHF